MSDLQTTRVRDMKPKLVWVGKMLGMDMYIDVGGQREPDRKLDLAEACLKKAFGMDHAASAIPSEEAFITERLKEYQQYWDIKKQRYIIESDWQPKQSELIESIKKSYQFEYGDKK